MEQVSLFSETNFDNNNNSVVTLTGCTTRQETNKGVSTETEDNISLDHEYIYVERGELTLLVTDGKLILEVLFSRFSTRQ